MQLKLYFYTFSPLASSAQAVLTVLFAKAMQARFSPTRFINAISHCSLLVLGLSGKALMTALRPMNKLALSYFITALLYLFLSLRPFPPELYVFGVTPI